MFFVVPLGHDKGVFRMPYVAIGVMAACVAVQLWMSFQPEPEPLQAIDLMRQALSGGEPSNTEIDRRLVEDPAFRWGFVPSRPRVVNWLSYAFVHGGWFHLIGNMLFLWLCGCNLEDRWGRGAFAVFYALGAVASALCFAALHPTGWQPMVGASGAISALMGAFLVLFFDARIRFGWVLFLIVVFRWGQFTLPAWVALPLWFLEQGWGMWTESRAVVDVAFSAHVGGFAFGAVAAGAARFAGLDRWLAARSDEAAPSEFREDDRFVRAMDLGVQGRPEDKQALLAALLRAKPSHEGAQVELCKMALARGAVAETHPTLDRVLLIMLRRGEARDAMGVWVDATPADGPSPPDRAYLAAARVFEGAGEPRDSLTTLGQLLNHHPNTSLWPRVLLEAARLQADKLGDRPGARKTLKTLLVRVPEGPFADQANARLAELAKL